MAKAKLIVNGYKVPDGFSGVAVRRACELIIERPGVTQKEVLEVATAASGLHLSTAGWITSPGPKSPACVLWERRKEGVFKCYPNEFTNKVTGSTEFLHNKFIEDVRRDLKAAKFIPKVGELVDIIDWNGSLKVRNGLFLGYHIVSSGAQNSEVFTNPEELLLSRPESGTHRFTRMCAVIMDHSTGLKHEHHGINVLRRSAAA